MADEVRCPECNARVIVPEGSAGKRLRCKKCDTVFRPEEDETPKRRVPKRDDDRPRRPRDDDEKPRARRAVADDDDEDDRPRKKGKKAKKKSSTPFILGACAALLLVVGAVGVVAWSQGLFDGGGDAADPFANANKPVERQFAQEEDYSVHVQLTYSGLYETRDDRVGTMVTVTFAKPRLNYNLYYGVIQMHDGTTVRTKLNGASIKDGTTVSYVTNKKGDHDIGFKYWIEKQRGAGKSESWVIVSNVFRMPEDAIKK